MGLAKSTWVDEHMEIPVFGEDDADEELVAWEMWLLERSWANAPHQPEPAEPFEPESDQVEDTLVTGESAQVEATPPVAGRAATPSPKNSPPMERSGVASTPPLTASPPAKASAVVLGDGTMRTPEPTPTVPVTPKGILKKHQFEMTPLSEPPSGPEKPKATPPQPPAAVQFHVSAPVSWLKL